MSRSVSELNLSNICDMLEEYMAVAVELHNVNAQIDQGAKGLGNKATLLSSQESNVFNKFLMNTPKDNLWYSLITSVGELCRSNAYTGAFDFLRGSLCRESSKPEWGNGKDIKDILEHYMIVEKTELTSRKNCEDRAKYRTKIDEIIAKLVKH